MGYRNESGGKSMGMDRRDLVEGLQKAFNGDDRERSTNDVADVE